MAEKIGQILIRKGKITPAQLREALRTQQFFGGYLGSHLINLGFIDEQSLGETLAEIFRVPFAPFETIRLAQREAVERVPAPLAQRFRLVPLQIDGTRLHVAMLNPRDTVAMGELAGVTGLIVTPWVAPEYRINQALERHYKLKREGRGPITLRAEPAPGPQPAPPAREPDAAPAGAAATAPAGAAAPPAGAAATAPAGAAAPPAGAAATPPAGETPRPDPGPRQAEVGFDGHPLDATVMPDLGGGTPEPKPGAPIPRSLDEWRELVEGVDGDRDDAPGRTAPAADPARRGPVRGSHPARRLSDGVGQFLEEDEAPSLPAAPAAGAGRYSHPRSGEGRPAPKARRDPLPGPGRHTAGEQAPPRRAAPDPARPPRSAAGLDQPAPPSPQPAPPARQAAPGQGIGNGLDQFQSAIALITSRDELARELNAFVTARFRRCAAFIVRQDQILGWTGAGPGVVQERVAKLAFRLGEPSLFAPVIATASPFIGPPPADPPTRQFYALLGGPMPPGILLLPVTLRDKLVAVLYMDNQADPPGPVDLHFWKRFSRMTAMSLEILILRNRLLQA